MVPEFDWPRCTCGEGLANVVSSKDGWRAICSKCLLLTRLCSTPLEALWDFERGRVSIHQREVDAADRCVNDFKNEVAQYAKEVPCRTCGEKPEIRDKMVYHRHGRTWCKMTYWEWINRNS